MANGIVLNIDTTKSEFQNPMVQLRQGDGNYQSLDITVTSNGEPLDLTGWTVTFMGTTAGGFKIVDAASVVTNALQGEFTYTPTKAWGQDQGEFKNAYFKFTKADETASGASFRVNVLEAVDLTAEESGDYISVVDALIDDVKTSMDTKLAETKQTLSDTQSQANTVQTHVNELNTNVNQLKAQNNAIKTTDNTWTGTNTFNKKIIATAGVQGNADTAGKAASADMLNTRIATFTDFAEVGKNMDLYIGNWRISDSSPVNNGPYGKTTRNSYVTVSSGGWYNAGLITFTDLTWGSRIYYIGIVAGGTLTWTKLSDDSTVVHNNGNETIAGDKTFTGATTFTQPINGALKTRDATFTDFATVAANMINYAGFWRVGSDITNAPQPGIGPCLVEVVPSTTPTNGSIRVMGYINNVIYNATVTASKLSWQVVADDTTVVHNTGTETVAGDKAFTGNSSFTGQTTLKSGNYGLRVTSSGVQKTSDGGTTWTNI